MEQFATYIETIAPQALFLGYNWAGWTRGLSLTFGWFKVIARSHRGRALFFSGGFRPDFKRKNK
jgi:hypothetical protein